MQIINGKEYSLVAIDKSNDGSYCKGCAFKPGHSKCNHPEYDWGYQSIGCEMDNKDYIFVELLVKDKLKILCTLAKEE